MVQPASLRLKPTLSEKTGTVATLVNAANCKTELSQQSLGLAAEHTGSTSDNHTLKLVFFTDTASCKANGDDCKEAKDVACLDGLPTCSDSSVEILENDTGEVCGCVGQTVNDVTKSHGDLSASDELLDLLLLSQTLVFTASVQLDTETSEPIYSLNPIGVIIDLDAPDTPIIAPTLGSGDKCIFIRPNSTECRRCLT